MSFAGMGDLQYPQIVRVKSSNGMGAMPRTRLPYADGGIPNGSYLTTQDLSRAEFENKGGVGEIGDMSDLGSLKKKLKKLVRRFSPIYAIKQAIAPSKPKTVQVVQVAQPAAAPAPVDPPPPSGTVPPGTPGSWVLSGTMPSGASYSYNFPDQASATAYGNQILAAGGQATASLSQVPQQSTPGQISYDQSSYSQSSGGGYSMPSIPQGGGSIPTPQSAPPTPIAPPTNNVPFGPGVWATAGTMPDGSPFAYFFPDDASAGSYAQTVANGGGKPSVYTPEEVAQGLVPGYGAEAPAKAGGGMAVPLALLAAGAYFWMKR